MSIIKAYMLSVAIAVIVYLIGAVAHLEPYPNQWGNDFIWAMSSMVLLGHPLIAVCIYLASQTKKP